jgi:DnaK suppressor protein
MAQAPDTEGSERINIMRNFLTHIRERQLSRIRELRHDQAGDVLIEPGDTLEAARSTEEFELHADLIAKAEDRLNQIHAAFERLDAGTYGICEKCRREIDLARLRALPFAAFCVECQKARLGDRGAGEASEEFMHHWSVPEGMVESLGGAEPLELPEGNASQLAGETFVPAPPAEPKKPKTRSKKPLPRRKS